MTAASAPDDGTTVPGAGARPSGNALPAGARLAEFEIRSVIGEGGFGIVYLAWDATLRRQVAIKEYMPATLAARTKGSQVMPRSDRAAETFALGLRSFVNEAHLLASFDHPSLLKVYRFWEANGTAYMVMPYYQGITLKRTLAALGAPPEEGWLLRQLAPLLDALDLMHRGHCYHRDISPDNILLLENGTPLLLDFGAARRVIGDATHALTAFLKPGYAPVEQYAEMPSMKQGPWTDLYALGSAVHYAITGRTPPESVARLVNDTMVPLATAAAGRYSDRFLRAIDHSLAVRPEQRPQSALEMRDELGIEERRARERKPGRIPTAPMPLEVAKAPDRTTLPPPRSLPAPPAETRGDPPGLPSAPPRRRQLRWWLAAGLALTAGLVLAVWQLPAQRSSESEGRAGAQGTTATGAVVRSAPMAPQAPTPLEPVAPSNATPSAATTPPLPDGAAASVATDAVPVRESSPPAAPRERSAPTPRKNFQNPRCTDIITRASLGEELSAQDQAILKGECRK